MTSEPQLSLRERQAQQVAAELRAQFLRLVVEHGPDGFTLADVADAAGVSERTLYRYYPSREALIEGVVDNEVRAFDRTQRPWGDIRNELAANPNFIADSFENFERHQILIRAMRLLRISGISPDASHRRSAVLRQVLAGLELDAEAAQQIFGLFRTLTGSDAWARMREADIDLDPRAAGYAVQWALQVLLDAAEGVEGPLRPASEGIERPLQPAHEDVDGPSPSASGNPG